MNPKVQIVIGLALVVAAVALATWMASNSDVPNDPNIGAGLLGLGGVAVLIGGVARALAARR